MQDGGKDEEGSPDDIKKKEEFKVRKNEGWYNLVAIVSALAVMRYLILNLIEFGFIMEVPLSQINLKDTVYFCLFFILNGLRCMFSYFLSGHGRDLAIGWVVLTEVVLSLLILFKIQYTYLSGWAHVISIVTDLKLISFHYEAHDATMKYFGYFLIIPTLVYKKVYVVKEKTDYRIIVRKSLRFVAYFFLFIFIMDQYAIPSIYKISNHNSYFTTIENCINVSISTVALFTLFFQLVFSCFLAIVSELTMFGEATYSEWWNSMSAGDFWIKWNMPVHQFIKHHVYEPLLRRNFGRPFSRTMCFVLSGIAHEFIIALAIKKISGLMFMAMLGQIPLIYISEKIKKRFPSYANIFFWLSFCVIGQPVIVLLFFRSIYIGQQQNYDVSNQSPKS